MARGNHVAIVDCSSHVGHVAIAHDGAELCRAWLHLASVELLRGRLQEVVEGQGAGNEGPLLLKKSCNEDLRRFFGVGSVKSNKKYYVVSNAG